MPVTTNGARLKVGQPVRRFEDERLIRGKGRFVDNMSIEGEAYLHFLRSFYGHARILGIDTSEAEAMPGVLGIFSGQDLLRDGVRPIPTMMPYHAPGRISCDLGTALSARH